MTDTSVRPNETWVRVAKHMCPYPFAYPNIEKYVPVIREAMARVGMDDDDMMLMALATVCVETGVGKDKFAPTDEYVSKYNTEKGQRLFGLYDFRRDLGNSREGDGALYKGRGFIQLTGKANYRDIGARIGIDLENNPDQANEPSVAAAILAHFLHRSQRQIRRALGANDMKEARRLVNGGRHGLPEFSTAMARGRAALAN